MARSIYQSNTSNIQRIPWSSSRTCTNQISSFDDININEIWSSIEFLSFFLSLFRSYWRRSFTSSIVIQVAYSLNLNGLDLYTKWSSRSIDIDIYISLWTNIWSVHRISNRTKHVRTLEPFIRAFRQISREHDSLSIGEFFRLFEDTSVCVQHIDWWWWAVIRFRILLLVSTRFRSVISRWSQLIKYHGIRRSTSNSFEVRHPFIPSFSFEFRIFSLKTDTKWLSWLAYQFHTAVSKRFHSSTGTSKHEYMDLDTFKNSFYFKVVCIVHCERKISLESRVVVVLVLAWACRLSI